MSSTKRGFTIPCCFCVIQVPLGVLDENDCSYKGMIAILDVLQKYVPAKVVDIKEKIPGNDLKKEKIFIPTLVGGDLLSTVRARGAVYIRGRSELQEDCLKGLLPACEDWHGKVCFMEVCSTIMMNP